jgi:hypothetical protein
MQAVGLTTGMRKVLDLIKKQKVGANVGAGGSKKRKSTLPGEDSQREDGGGAQVGKKAKGAAKKPVAQKAVKKEGQRAGQRAKSGGTAKATPPRKAKNASKDQKDQQGSGDGATGTNPFMRYFSKK